MGRKTEQQHDSLFQRTPVIMPDACFSYNMTQFIENCTFRIDMNQKAPLEFALPLYGYVIPAVVLVTVVTNSFIVIVMSRKHLRTPTNTILLAMAVAEMLTGATSVPWLLYYYTFEGHLVDQRVGMPSFWCASFTFFSETVPTICHTTAIWLTVFLAVQRYVYVCMPRLSPRWCTMPLTKLVIVALSVGALLLEVPKALSGYHRTHVVYDERGDFRRMCVFHYAEWLQRAGVDVFYITYFWLLVVFVHTVPCVVLAAFSTILIRYIKRADRRKHESLMRRRQQDSPPRGRKTLCIYFHATTKMLLVVILVFLLIEIPAAVIFALHVFLVIFNLNSFYSVMNVALIFRNVLIMLSYPFNFAVYCGMSYQFRLTVRQLFTREKLCYVHHPVGFSGGKRYSVILIKNDKQSRRDARRATATTTNLWSAATLNRDESTNNADGSKKSSLQDLATTEMHLMQPQQQFSATNHCYSN